MSGPTGRAGQGRRAGPGPGPDRGVTPSAPHRAVPHATDRRWREPGPRSTNRPGPKTRRGEEQTRLPDRCPPEYPDDGWLDLGVFSPRIASNPFLRLSNPTVVARQTPELLLADRQGRRYVRRLDRLADDIEEHLAVLEPNEVAQLEVALERLAVKATLALARVRACVAIRAQKRRRVEGQRARRRRQREAKKNDFAEILRRAARDVGRSGAFEDSPR